MILTLEKNIKNIVTLRRALDVESLPTLCVGSQSQS